MALSLSVRPWFSASNASGRRLRGLSGAGGRRYGSIDPVSFSQNPASTRTPETL